MTDAEAEKWWADNRMKLTGGVKQHCLVAFAAGRASAAAEIARLEAENKEYKGWCDGEGYESTETVIAHLRGQLAKLLKKEKASVTAKETP